MIHLEEHIGRVENFDGITGNIITNSNEKYTFSYVGAYSGIKDGDIVSFLVRDYLKKIVSDVVLLESAKKLDDIINNIRNQFVDDLNDYYEKLLKQDSNGRKR